MSPRPYQPEIRIHRPLSSSPEFCRALQSHRDAVAISFISQVTVRIGVNVQMREFACKRSHCAQKKRKRSWVIILGKEIEPHVVKCNHARSQAITELFAPTGETSYLSNWLRPRQRLYLLLSGMEPLAFPLPVSLP